MAACSEGTRSMFNSSEAARTRLVASLSNGIAPISSKHSCSHPHVPVLLKVKLSTVAVERSTRPGNMWKSHTYIECDSTGWKGPAGQSSPSSNACASQATVLSCWSVCCQFVAVSGETYRACKEVQVYRRYSACTAE